MSNTKRYKVLITVDESASGCAYVEADSPEDAIDKAREKAASGQVPMSLDEGNYRGTSDYYPTSDPEEVTNDAEWQRYGAELPGTPPIEVYRVGYVFGVGQEVFEEALDCFGVALAPEEKDGRVYVSVEGALVDIGSEHVVTDALLALLLKANRQGCEALILRAD